MPRPDTEIVFDPATYVDAVPLDALARLRRDRPVAWADEIPVLGWPAGPGFWLVLRHADVESVMRRPGLFSSWLGATQIRDPATPAALGYVRNMMLNMDPPGHSRLRQLLTLADVLGMPEQDRWLLFDWSNRVIGYQDPDYASSADFDPSGGTPMAAEAVSLRPAPGPGGRMPDPRTRDGMPDLYAYAHLLADAKRRRPGDDVMSILLAQADDHGGRVSAEEFENMFWLFAVAGNETLRNGLPGACIALLEHPQAQDELRADAGLIPGAVEEMLRWWTPVMTFRRTATSDCEIGGQRIGAGDKVVVSFTSANRDETVFSAPDRFDIRRQPNPHLVFGHGPHFCLGAHLARTQMRALFAEVLARTSCLTYAGPPAYLRSNFQRGVKRLPITWTA